MYRIINLDIMKLILARHGETIENTSGILQGHLPGELSKAGILHAQHLASIIAGDLPDKIYSSDLKRARDTAKIVAETHLDIPLEFTPDLRERDIGEFTGKTKKEIGKENEKFLITSLNPIDGESLQDLFNRAQKFITRLLTKHKNDTILIIAHNGINKAIEAAITNRNPNDINNIPNQSNDQLKIFNI